jgi:hypothetical protein
MWLLVAQYASYQGSRHVHVGDGVRPPSPILAWALGLTPSTMHLVRLSCSVKSTVIQQYFFHNKLMNNTFSHN